MFSVLRTPISRIKKNMAFEIIAAVADRVRVKP